MPTVTALRPVARSRVAVDLDGSPWRTLPAEAVVRAGIRSGDELDRATARQLRRELRRFEALAVAARSLRHRDLSAQALAARLERANVGPAAGHDAVQTLARAGVVDDRRFAAARAEMLAGRGYGDDAIRADLEQQGVCGELAADALEGLEPEADRARELVRRRGMGAKTARFLASKGFGEEAVEAAMGTGFANSP